MEVKMTTQEQERIRLHHKSLVEHFVRLSWNSGKYNLLKQLATSDFVCHQNNLDGFFDIDTFIDYVKEIRTAVPDLTITIEELVAEGNKAFSMATFSGTFEKAALGREPNNCVLSFNCMTVWEFRRGKVLSQNTMVDLAALRSQVNQPADFKLKANTMG